MSTSSLMSECLSHVAANGWAWIPSISQAQLETGLCSLGPFVSARFGESDAVDLRPYRQDDAPKASMSAVVGSCAQPMHTDAAYYARPPRYIALYCVEKGEAPCPTHVWALDWQRLMLERPSILLEPGWVSRGGRHAPFYCQILTTTAGGRGFVRFDPICMKLPRRIGALEAVTETLTRYASRTDFYWSRGDAVIVDNWRCLHARGDGAADAPSRRLRRWYIGESNGLGL
jgi:hypothetical protein